MLPSGGFQNCGIAARRPQCTHIIFTTVKRSDALERHPNDNHWKKGDDVRQHEHVPDAMRGTAAFVVPAMCAPVRAWLSRIALEGEGARAFASRVTV
jgi:hypothetical protein